MLKSHDKFYSSNGKRKILVVDDEEINRIMMEGVLESDYEVLCARDGQSAMQMIRENRDTLSMILLDLMMPGMSGKEVLERIKADPQVHHIPVIVLTADLDAEVEILGMGASDFIPKPYPQPKVILARILRSIELSEDRGIIRDTERDPLTELYNREYFYRYAERFDQHHKDLEMDAIVVDVNHFHMINERFGTAYGDDVLRRIGQKVREIVEDTGGIVCRREADTFMIYCPHGKDYREILEHASIGLAGDDSANNRVRLRMGVYENVDKQLEIERRFDRAKMAANMVRNSFARTIGLYDNNLHEREIFEEQLVEDFQKAVSERQFQVYYQPKFDVRHEIPVLASAEALVRWIHPEHGMISPGVFIPLFEDNGLIKALDNYVWEMAAAQIRDWKQRLGLSVPVSVNVSRIDMYDPKLIETFQNILNRNGIGPEDFYLEITESAYTQDSEQIIETVNRLRSLGFRIEMDDFGTGYSSLNMISTLPIDALKLDMQFIRTAFSERKDTRMLEVIIDIADYLSVPVIAEGVETEEQLTALKAMGCDLVQGYYFSKPIPNIEFEEYVVRRIEQNSSELPTGHSSRKRKEAHRHEPAFGKIAYALSSGFVSVYYVDTRNDHYVEFSSEGTYEDLQIRRSGANFFEDAARVITRTVHREDQTRVLSCMKKEALLTQVVDGAPFSITYRVMINDRPEYHSLKVVRVNTHDDHHIVVGVSNIDEQIRLADHQEAAKNALDFNSLAKALSNDLESIYYIDTDTNMYMEFVTDGVDNDLRLHLRGMDFFRECMENIRNVVYLEDQERIRAAFQKETLLETLKKHPAFSIDYRMMIDGEPKYYRMKILSAGGADHNHVIIGVSNIEEEMAEKHELEAERASAAAYSRIAQALAQDYFSIYYVNTETDQFIEYSSDTEYAQMGFEKEGENFFELSRKNILRVMYPDDIEEFLTSFTKENILRAKETTGVFTLTYRLMFNNVPTYVHMKASRMADKSDPHIVIGVSNIDEQMRREQEHASALRKAREAANKDPLTGVKSKHAYKESERLTDEMIRSGQEKEFAIVLCDVNGLKEVNDTRGHAAGDDLICAAAMRICHIFQHSPVYRYGGDEFIAVLRGRDYANRHALLEQMEKKNRESAFNGEEVVACGLSEYIPGTDQCMENVFERADAAMYENKKKLKEEREDNAGETSGI